MTPTPGPWHVVKGWDERSWMVDSANGTPIAAVPDTRLNARENARLISAAPELLEAAKAALEALRALKKDHFQEGALLQRAIDKAEERP